MSFIRASFAVNCQLTLAFLVFLTFCEARASFTSEMLSIRRFKHCPVKTFNSISAMLWGVDKLKSIPKGFCFFRWKCFIKGTGSMGVQVVHNQCDELCILVFISDCFQETSPVILVFFQGCPRTTFLLTVHIQETHYTFRSAYTHSRILPVDRVQQR